MQLPLYLSARADVDFLLQLPPGEESRRRVIPDGADQGTGETRHPPSFAGAEYQRRHTDIGNSPCCTQKVEG